MTEINKTVNARQFLGGGAGPSGGATPDATSSSHAIYKWVERSIKDNPGASVSIDPNTGQMIIGSYDLEYPVSMYDWVVQSENNMFYVLSDAKFKELYGSASEVRMSEKTIEDYLSFDNERGVKQAARLLMKQEEGLKYTTALRRVKAILEERKKGL